MELKAWSAVSSGGDEPCVSHQSIDSEHQKLSASLLNKLANIARCRTQQKGWAIGSGQNGG